MLNKYTKRVSLGYKKDVLTGKTEQVRTSVTVWAENNDEAMMCHIVYNIICSNKNHVKRSKDKSVIILHNRKIVFLLCATR